MRWAKVGALRIGGIALVALALLQIVWHVWLAPPAATQLWPTLALAMGPLLPGLWVCGQNLRRGVLIGGIVSLFYFSHGISAAWAEADLRALASAEIALSLIVIAALGWDARQYRRKVKDGPRAES